jgi:hypothetical protein
MLNIVKPWSTGTLKVKDIRCAEDIYRVTPDGYIRNARNYNTLADVFTRAEITIHPTTGIRISCCRRLTYLQRLSIRAFLSKTLSDRNIDSYSIHATRKSPISLTSYKQWHFNYVVTKSLDDALSFLSNKILYDRGKDLPIETTSEKLFETLRFSQTIFGQDDTEPALRHPNIKPFHLAYFGEYNPFEVAMNPMLPLIPLEQPQLVTRLGTILGDVLMLGEKDIPLIYKKEIFRQIEETYGYDWIEELRKYV